MANDFSGWPWKIDTPGATLLVAKSYVIKKIKWISASAIAGDQAILQNAHNRTFYHGLAFGANFTEMELFENELPISGLKATTLDSGVLYVYYEISGRKWQAVAK